MIRKYIPTSKGRREQFGWDEFSCVLRDGENAVAVRYDGTTSPSCWGPENRINDLLARKLVREVKP